MAGVKETFLAALERDDSGFLTRYLAAEVRPRRGGDNRGMLEERWQLLQAGEFQPAEFVQTVLEVLILEPKVHPKKEVYDLLWDWARELGGKKVFHGIRAFKDRFVKLQELLKTPAGMALPMNDEQLAALHEGVAGALLLHEAEGFVYDLRERKKDRTLVVLDAYCREKGLTLAPSDWSEEVKADWEALFPILRAEKNINVLLPVRVDPMTGAGLFIVGKRYYYSAYAPEWMTLAKKKREGLATPRDEMLARRKKQLVDDAFKGSCCYAWFRLDRVVAARNGAPALLQIGPSEFDNNGAPMVCLDLNEALRWYEEMTGEGEEAYSTLIRQNGPPPEGCPPRLLAYFDTL